MDGWRDYNIRERGIMPIIAQILTVALCTVMVIFSFIGMSISIVCAIVLWGKWRNPYGL